MSYEYEVIERSYGTPLDDKDISHLSGYLASDKTDLSEPYSLAADRIIIYNRVFKCISGGVLFVRDSSQFRTQHLTDKPIKYEEKSIEMNGLWISGGVPRYVSLGFWAHVCDYIRKLEDHHIYFSYATQKRGLDNFYRWASGTTLYEGPVKAIPGMPGESFERIVHLPVKELVPHIDSLLMRKAVHYLKGADEGA